MLNFFRLSETDKWALVHYLKEEIMPPSSSDGPGGQ